MHFYNFCTFNGYHFILSIKTGNDHKYRMLPPTLITTCKMCERKGIEANGGGQIMDAFIITEMHYLLVSLLCDLVRPLFLIFAEVSSVPALFALFHKH